MHKKTKALFLFLFLLSAGALNAANFKSYDGQFSIDMPPGWQAVKSDKPGAVLSLKKDSAKLEVVTIPECTTEACLENKVNEDLVAVKLKKMRIIGNTYTGEEIKRIEFSTGEPFFYINFAATKTEFSAGYFMLNGNAYSVLASNLSYAETDLLFSFITPLARGVDTPRTYATYAIPKVVEQVIAPPSDAPVEAEPAPLPEPKPAKTPAYKKQLVKFKEALAKNNYSFISKNMPSFFKSMGRVFDLLVIVTLFYIFAFAVILAVKIFVRGKEPAITANPASVYPVKFNRMYGTPSVIFMVKDNQGNKLVSFNTRWHSVFMFTGIFLACMALLLSAALSINEMAGIIKMQNFVYNTFYSVTALIIPIGFFIFGIGLLISLLSLREYTIYDKNGQKTVYILQNGYGLKEEKYTVYFNNSKNTLELARKKFAPRRHWTLKVHNNPLAVIEEKVLWRALCRKLFGHGLGLFRASYEITGPQNSKGAFLNSNKAFNTVTLTIDKPQAVSSRDLISAALVISARDRDKWYPSAN